MIVKDNIQFWNRWTLCIWIASL